MSIAFGSLLTSGTESVASDTEFSTPSVSPSAGDVTFLAVAFNGSYNTDPTVSGCGLTWTKVAHKTRDGNGRWCGLWRGVGTPSSGAITVTRGGSDTWSNVNYHVFTMTGVDTTTPVRTANNASTAVTPEGTICTVTYPLSFNAGGAGLAVFGFGGGNGSATPRSGWTEIADNSITSQQFFETQYILGSDTIATATPPSAGYQSFAMAFELVPAASGAPMTMAILQH